MLESQKLTFHLDQVAFMTRSIFTKSVVQKKERQLSLHKMSTGHYVNYSYFTTVICSSQFNSSSKVPLQAQI